MTPAALWTAAAVVASAIFAFDLMLPLGVAGGVPYVALVLLAFRGAGPRYVYSLAAAGSILTVLGFFLSEPGSTLWVVLTNRALALFAIWISVPIVLRLQRANRPEIQAHLQLESVMNSVMDAIIISDERTNILSVNNATEAMFGYKARELIGKNVSILRPEPDRTQNQKQIEEFLRTGKKKFVGRGLSEARGQRKDGTIFTMEIQAGELLHEGKCLFVGTIRDVTPRKTAQDAHRQMQALFEKAFQTRLHLSSLTRISDRCVIDVNDTWLRTMGYAREDVVGKEATDLDLWEDTGAREAIYKELEQTGRVDDTEATWHTKDGQAVEVLISAERLDLDDGSALLLIAHDQTEHKRAEAALRESEDRFEKAFRGAPLMMSLMKTSNNRLLDVNDTWVERLGYSRDEVIGKSSSEFPLWVRSEDRIKAHGILTKTGSLRSFETQWRKLDGSIIDVRIQSELFDFNGERTSLNIARDTTEEKRAAQALHESEARFRDVAEISSDWIWETDTENRITYISERVRDTLGFGPEIIIGSPRGASDRIADRGSEAWKRHLEEVAQRKPFENFIYEHFDTNGELRYIQVSGKPVFDPHGTFLGYRGLGADITEQRRTEIARTDAEQQRDRTRMRLQSIMDNVLEGIVTINDQGTIDTINPAAEELFGYASGELVGQNISAVAPDPHRAKHDEYLGRYIETGEARILGKPRELTALRKDGSEVPVELRVSEIRMGRKRKFVGAIRDLTDRRAAEEALRRSEEHLRAVIENSSDVISIVDADGSIRFESPALERISGYSRNELKGRHVSTLAHHDDSERVVEAFSKLIENPGGEVVIQYRASHKDGSWLTIESIAKNMLDNPVVKGVVVTSRDMTEHKRARDALMAAKEEAEYANRTKTEFLANMSHELRTPLNAVIGFAGMIEKELYGPLNNKKYAESAVHINESATHLLTLINDLLDIAKIEVGKMDLFEEETEVGPIVRQMLRVIEPRALQAGVSVHSDVSDDLPMLWADARMLKQVILNLISNAVKFTLHGGTVQVSAGIVKSGGLVLTVRDTGIGMCAEDIPTALAPFGQIKGSPDTAQEGTGLGLPLVKSLIEMHGGTLEIDSAVGSGTAVTVSYPADRVRHRIPSQGGIQAKAS